jgi:hypothetical protein
MRVNYQLFDQLTISDPQFMAQSTAIWTSDQAGSAWGDGKVGPADFCIWAKGRHLKGGTRAE